MNSITYLTAKQLSQAANLKQQIESLQDKLSQMLGTATRSPASAPRAKRKMSAAGRARIIAAQKARWAKVKGKKKPAQRGKRKMSAAARAKIAAAAKARWARAKAAGRRKL